MKEESNIGIEELNVNNSNHGSVVTDKNDTNEIITENFFDESCLCSRNNSGNEKKKPSTSCS